MINNVDDSLSEQIEPLNQLLEDHQTVHETRGENYYRI
jgi:hypothetical protein